MNYSRLICQLIILINASYCYRLTPKGNTIKFEDVHKIADCSYYQPKTTLGSHWGYQFSKYSRECPNDMHILDPEEFISKPKLRGGIELVCCKKNIMDIIKNITILNNLR